MVEHYVLTPAKRGRKPKVKETPNYGAVRTKSIKQTIVSEPETEIKAKPAEKAFIEPVAEITEIKAELEAIPVEEVSIEPVADVTEIKAEPEAIPTEEVYIEPITDVKPEEELAGLPEREIVVMLFEKSPYNFLPPMTDIEFEAVKKDIREHGYDDRFPIWHFEDKTLDGFHKDKACAELFAEGYTDKKYKPVYKEFVGTVRQAKEFVARSAKGRNLSTEQCGMIAVHETPEYLAEVIETVKKESKENKLRGKKSDLSTSPTKVKNPYKRKSKTKAANTVGTTPAILAKIQKFKAELSTEEFDQLAYEIENRITTLKEFEAKRRAEQKAIEMSIQPPIPTGNTTDLLTGDSSTMALGTSVDSKGIVTMTEHEDEHEDESKDEPKEHKPFKPILTERYVNDHATRGLRKVIALQMGKKVIEDKIQSVGTGDTKELNEKRSALIDEIHMNIFEFGYLMYFGKKYDHDTMKNFDEMARL